MNKLQFNYGHARQFIQKHELVTIREHVENAHYKLHEKDGADTNYIGWLHWPETYDKEEFARIEKVAAKISATSDVFIVIGIGGSYAGAKAAIEMLNNSFSNGLEKSKRKAPEVVFVGHHLSGTYIAELLDYIEDKDVSINVISKSGTTTEPAIAFRIMRKYLEKRYGKEEAKTRIYVTTDKEKGALKQLAERIGYESFSIPANVGGRYSVLTSVGMLPMAVSGIDIHKLIQGAADAASDLAEPDLEVNPAYQYAAIRNLFYTKGKTIELLVNDEPAMTSFAEWWKQLFGESEGKDGKGLFPAAANFTTDLHSFGQYIQDGRRHLFETFIFIDKPRHDIAIEACELNLDNLNYIADSGFTLNEVNAKAMEATVSAHTDGGVPNLIIRIPELTAYHVGYLFYFFQKACAISSYLLGVNPFDQPGVEAYKNNLFQLLGKQGYEKQ